MSIILALDALPGEILAIVVLYMDLKSTITFSKTCRTFYNLVKGSITIQLHLELAGEKLHLNPALRPNLSSGKWYNRLAQVRQAWLNLETTPLPPFRLSLDDSKILSTLQGGIFTCGSRAAGTSGGTNKVKVMKLSPTLAEAGSLAGHTYPSTVVSNGRYVAAFRSSVEQDLLVLGSLTSYGPSLKLYSLSTGESHPRAKKNEIVFQTDRFLGFATQDPQPIQIQGDLVSALLCSGRIGTALLEWEIRIWNWKTGDLILQNNFISYSITFTFLSSSSYMLAEHEKTVAHLLVSDIDAGPDSSASVPRFKLQLPELSPGWRYGPITFKNDLPSPADESCRSGQAFLPDSSAGVICLPIGLSGSPSNPDEQRITSVPHLALFIGREALQVDVLGPRKGKDELVELEWKQWGEYAARWVDMGEAPGLLPGVHGSRFVQLVCKEPSPSAWLQVLDFNSSTIRRYPVPASKDAPEGIQPEPVRIGNLSTSFEKLSIVLANANRETPVGNTFVETFDHDRPTIIDIPGAFLHEVVSRLPYRSATRAAPFLASAEWTTDGEYLLRVDEPEGGNDYRVVHPYAISDGSEEAAFRGDLTLL
ncbi:hypothetical protein BDV93DRAFT_605278 [Ceratobasidium sp. AG-I]|nr:hypothetical protein BDV93DRAFT_605278 [Ceratobasidium sp. AG-I]